MSGPGTSLNRKIQAELTSLVERKVLSWEQAQRIGERYPATPFDLLVLVRWFTLLGAVVAGVGLLMIIREGLSAEVLVEGGLSLGSVGALAGGWFLERRKGFVRSGRALGLMGALMVQALTVAIAAFHPTGSDDWPSLVGVDAVLMALIAYGFGNPMVLVIACLDGAVWLGAEGWYGLGMYALLLKSPPRIFLAGAVALGAAVAHIRFAWKQSAGFGCVYAHFGLLSIHIALWFFAVFGWFDDPNDIHWSAAVGQRLLFSILWAGASAGCIYAGSKLGLGFVRSYGLVFLGIDVYTFYFQFVVANSGEAWFLHLLVVGGSLVGLGFWAESKLRKPAAGPPPPVATPPAAPPAV